MIVLLVSPPERSGRPLVSQSPKGVATMDNGELLTVRQVADQLDISRYQVYRRIARGDLRAKQARYGQVHYLIDPADLAAYIAAGGPHTLSGPRIDNLEMMRVSEVALATGFSVEAVRRMCYSGRLPYFRGMGPKGHLRIPRRAVEEILSGKRR